ncbi:LicD family-domain-containing protein [Xylaria arbuscula]|nr:LicD family-domain-containing protein [Xylaria arbuscula]
MHVLHVFLTFILAINAAPFTVTEEEVVIVTAPAVALETDAEAAPVSTDIAPVKAEIIKAKLLDDPEDNSPPPPTEKKPQGNVNANKESPKENPKNNDKQKKPAPDPKANPKPKQKQKPKPKAKDQKPKEQKYFHEPGWDLESGHYDERFFQGKVPYEQHRSVLRHLVRSYLTTLKDLGVQTWLAHGSLLGWWWNGQIMPWDYDLDVQVSVATLAFLAERYNLSTHEYEFEVDDDDEDAAAAAKGTLDFRLDVNATEFVVPDSSVGVSGGNSTDYDSIMVRDDGGGKGAGGGVGDGGDGLGINNKELVAAEATTAAPPVTTTIKKTYLLDINPHYAALTKGNGANIIDARWIDTSNGMFIDITGLRERDAQKSPGVWSCKNNHRYRTGELWPLRRTEFEGAEAWIPYAFDKVLTDEYGPKSLVAEEWAGHRWIPERREWVRLPKKKKKKKPSTSASPKKHKVEHITTDDGKNIEIVYEEVIVEA